MNKPIKKSVSSVSACPDDTKTLINTGLDSVQGLDTEIKERVQPVHNPMPFTLAPRNTDKEKAGVYFHGVDKNGDPKPPEWICAPLEITARTRDKDSEEWGRLLVWHDPDGIRKDWAMPESLLAGEASQILAPLLAGGLTIAQKHKKTVASYIGCIDPDNRTICVNKTGWAAPSVFVTPNKVIDKAGGSDNYKFQSEARPEPQQGKGTPESWKQKVAALCAGNSRLMFGVSTAFAGPLLYPCGFTGGGFHFIGSSSIGKSLAMTMAASVMDNPEKAVITWRTTDNGLEGIAARHNDGLLMLDELGQVDGKKAGEIAYMLANGTGKARANKEGAAKTRLSWRLIVLSNGEIDLASHMEASGKQARAGQEVRMVTIPADAGQSYGIFENLHGEANSQHMADKVKAATLNNYGRAFIPYLQYLAENWDCVKQEGKKLVANFINENVPTNADGQVSRAAERFGIVAAAGEIASAADVTGWQKGDATKAAKVCFDAWLNRRGGIGSHEEREIIQRVAETLTKHAARFESNTISGTAINRLGFIMGNEYALPVPGFKEMMKGFDEKLAAQVLEKNGIIKHAIGKELPRKALPGLGRQRCYTISMDDVPDV